MSDYTDTIQRMTVELISMARDAALEEAAQRIEPKEPRPCDCKSCYCGNSGDSASVAAWDADTDAAKIIRLMKRHEYIASRPATPSPRCQGGGRVRSDPFQQGYRNGMKAAVQFLHDRAKEMNDFHAKQVLNSAALGLGVKAKSILPVLIPPEPQNDTERPT